MRDLLDAGQDLGDDLLARRGVRLVAQLLEVRDQLGVDEAQERLAARLVELAALVGPGLGGVLRGGRGPVVPAVGLPERGAVAGAEGLGFQCLAVLGLVEDAEEENPRQFGDVLQRAGDVAAAHDVADRPDGGIHGLLRAMLLAVRRARGLPRNQVFVGH